MDGGKVVRGSRDQVARYRRVLWRSLVVLQQPVDYLTPRCSRSTTTAPRPGSQRSNASDQFPSAACRDGKPSTASKLPWAIDEFQGGLQRSGAYRPGGFEARPDCQPEGSGGVARPHASCPQ